MHPVLWCLVCCLGYKSLPPLSVHHSARTSFSKVNVLQTINYVASYLPSKMTFVCLLSVNFGPYLIQQCDIPSETTPVYVTAPVSTQYPLSTQEHGCGQSLTRQKEFTISLRFWLGIPLFPSNLGSKRCFCGQILDQFGDHLLGCGHNNL